MKPITTLVSLCIVLCSLLLSGCGQKGPIEIERPQLAQEEVQDNMQAQDLEGLDLQESVEEAQAEQPVDQPE